MEIGGRDCGGRRKGKDWGKTERSERKSSVCQSQRRKRFRELWGKLSAFQSNDPNAGTIPLHALEDPWRKAKARAKGAE